ncbi:MAG: hypothetical protein RQ761_06750 [Bacteroidales bacterium]|nr:hypothetical protein [Bacteroidales bacterium]
MKKTVITVIITLIAAAAIVFIAYSIWGEGKCFTDDHEEECTEVIKKGGCDKMNAEASHDKFMEGLMPARTEFDSKLSEEDKMIIAGIREKFAGIDHTKMCPQGKDKFMEENKADFDALTAIANNHKEYLDGLYAKMHARHEETCSHMGAHKAKASEETPSEEVMANKCPEISNCKEATEKCQGEKIAEAEKEKCEELEKKCAKATEECEKECMNTFKIHFLLMDVA